MNTQEAAKKTVSIIRGKFQPKRDIEGRTRGHAMWMLKGIAEGYVQYEKAHRWLGYAQGILVAHGELSLENAKEVNKEASS